MGAYCVICAYWGNAEDELKDKSYWEFYFYREPKAMRSIMTTKIVVRHVVKEPHPIQTVMITSKLKK